MSHPRRLGRSELVVQPVGLGCMGFSAFYGDRPDDDVAIKVIRDAVELGYNHFDTADVYGPHTNEVLVGRALRDLRHKVFIATKFGIKVVNGVREISNDPNYIKECCNASLQRLGIQTIDLYYMHRRDIRVPIEDAIRAMAELVQEGKVRYLGLSECSAETIRRAHAIHPITAIQNEYSLFTRDIETNGILDTCRELGISIVAYSPLGRGILSKRVTKLDDLPADDWRRQMPRFTEENLRKNNLFSEALDEIAKEKSCTASQLALAWVLSRGEEVVTIPGTTKESYMRSNFESSNIILSSNDLQRIEEIYTRYEVGGDRYDNNGLKMVNL